MKISRAWLQKYFEKPLPEAQMLADALTFHAFEIESISTYDVDMGSDAVLDVKVTPNRGHDCLSHRGIAKELSAIMRLPMRSDSLRSEIHLEPECADISVYVEDARLCPRFAVGYIKGVEVGPSPEWLKEHLEAIGQRSINNVVDATNFVMFDIGQPVHAFDAAKLANGGRGTADSGYRIEVRKARAGEKMIALDDKEYVLSESNLVVADKNSGKAVGIAGVKGGKPASITEATKDIIVECANFDGISVRKTAAALKLRTDASDRFQQVIAPELVGFGMRQVVELIASIAGGEIVGFVDKYPASQKPRSISVPDRKVSAVLGAELGEDDIVGAFERLGFSFEQKGGDWNVAIPFERLDLTIAEDLVEEIGRIIGYDKISAAELPHFSKKPEVNPNLHAAEKMREELMANGYSEVYTSVFVESGERAVANKIGGERPYLRATLADSLKEAYGRNERNKDLLGLKEVKLFEIGVVWKDGKELIMIGRADSGGVREEPLSPIESNAYDDLPTSATQRYEPFSKYPFIVRDISMWVPQGPEAISEALVIFGEQGGMLLRHVELFDQFKKGERISYAFRLVLQSFEKTLTDEEANAVMERIYAAVQARGWEVR